MHKTVNVSIGQSAFVIEENAYASLDAYLQAIRKHFAKTGDADEIVSDIEDRIAEEFSEKIGGRKKVILLEDVTDVIKRMGTVEDFKKFEGDEKADDGPSFRESMKKIRLYRDADDQVLGGVAAGIAKYFDIDPLFIRIAFFASIFAGGFGIVLYILLWVILPEARTTAEKVEMTGGRVTLSSLQEKIDAKIPPEKRKSAVRKAVGAPFAVIRAVLRFVANVLRFVVPLVGRIAGFAVMIAAAFALAMLTLFLLTLLINPSSPYIGFPLHETVGQGMYAFLLLTGYLLAFLPIVTILLLGVSLLLLRSAFTTASVAIIITTWFVALTAFGAAATTSAPKIEEAVREHNETHYVIQETPYDLKNFDRIAIGGNGHAVIRKGTAFSVVLKATEQNRGRVSVSVEGGELLFDRNEDWNDRCIFFCARTEPVLEVTMPALSSVFVKNASSAELDDFGDAPLSLEATHAGWITANTNAKTVTADLTHAAFIELRGSGGLLTANISEGAELDASRFTVNDATMTMTHGARADVNVRGTLRGSVEHGARLEYRTRPATIDVDVKGGGRLSDGSDGY